MNKNWLNDPKIDYKPPSNSNLVKLIEKDLEFESSIEWDEVLDIISMCLDFTILFTCSNLTGSAL